MENLKNGAPMTEEVVNNPEVEQIKTDPENDEVTVEQVIDQEAAHPSIEDAGC
jgi:hypothetical protein